MRIVTIDPHAAWLRNQQPHVDPAELWRWRSNRAEKRRGKLARKIRRATGTDLASLQVAFAFESAVMNMCARGIERQWVPCTRALVLFERICELRTDDLDAHAVACSELDRLLFPDACRARQIAREAWGLTCANDIGERNAER